MAIQGLAEQAAYKKFLVKMLSKRETTDELNQIIKKCMDISDIENQHSMCLKTVETENEKLIQNNFTENA